VRDGFERGGCGRKSAQPWQDRHLLGNLPLRQKPISRKAVQSPKRDHRHAGRYRQPANGNLLLNFPLHNSGALDSYELKMLDEITRWIAVNSEVFSSTRPWKMFGEGPARDCRRTGQRLQRE